MTHRDPQPARAEDAADRDRRRDRHPDPRPPRRLQRDEPGDDRRADGRLRLARRPGAAAGADRHRRRQGLLRRRRRQPGSSDGRRGSDEIDLPSEVRRGAEVLHQAIVDLRRIPYPVIAAVNGPAAGAGFSLALPATPGSPPRAAFFACAYGRIGASPDGGMTYFLPRVVGPAPGAGAAARRPATERRARRSREGIVAEVVPADELMDARPREGREAGGEGAPLRADGEAAGRGRASRTPSPSTCSSSATGSPTAWRPRTCARASRRSSRAARPTFTRVAEP